jgi:hypothetical protein
VVERHQIDELNGVIAARSEAASADAVRADSLAVHAEVLDFLDGMSEEQLSLPYSHYQPKAADASQPVYGWVNGNTWGHYDEHIGWLKAGLK